MDELGHVFLRARYFGLHPKLICPACSQESWGVLYDGQIRDGSFGKLTAGKIFQCGECKLARLAEFGMEYETGSYREKYNNTNDPQTLVSMHDHEQAARISLIGFERLRGKTVLDHGCGHGAFLDAIKGVSKTIGIEPMQSIRPDLEKRGHIIYGDSADALTAHRGKVDIVVSFGVIEHVDDPVQYLRDSYDLLTDSGSLFLQTDNLDDVLMKSGAPGFEPFFYRTAHNWYFSRENLKTLAKKAGFSVETSTSHGYDFSNFLMWHKEAQPTGNGKLRLFDPAFEAFWKATIEAQGLGELITMTGTKSA